MSKAEKSILEAMEKISGRLKGVEDVQSGMLQQSYEDKLRGKFPSLSSDDIDKVLALAMKDRSKDIWQHGEDVAKGKSSMIEEATKKWAEDHGLDYDEVVKKRKQNENDLKDLEASGGGAALLAKGKKISFRPGDDVVTPRQLTQEFFDMKRQ